MQIGSVGLGQIIAIVVLVLALVFLVVGSLSPIVAGLVAALAIARLT